MSLMNGVDSEKLISDEIGASHVIYSVIKVASHKEENGYCFNPETTIGIIFGEPCAPYDSERVQAIEALFADTGLHYRSTEYIREEMWSKFRLNVWQQPAPGNSRGRSWLLPGQRSYESNQRRT